jgi:hypothetical protein
MGSTLPHACSSLDDSLVPSPACCFYCTVTPAMRQPLARQPRHIQHDGIHQHQTALVVFSDSELFVSRECTSSKHDYLGNSSEDVTAMEQEKFGGGNEQMRSIYWREHPHLFMHGSLATLFFNIRP